MKIIFSNFKFFKKENFCIDKKTCSMFDENLIKFQNLK